VMVAVQPHQNLYQQPVGWFVFADWLLDAVILSLWKHNVSNFFLLDMFMRSSRTQTRSDLEYTEALSKETRTVT
jgi:hypothetical protein